MSEVKVIVKCSHIISQSAQIERVAATHHVSHACDTAKVPVGSMHCPCTANGCCSRVPIVMAHACAVPCDWIAMQPSIAMQHSWSFTRVMHMPPHHRGFICSLGHSLKRLLMPPHHRGFIRSLGHSLKRLLMPPHHRGFIRQRFHSLFGSFIEETFDASPSQRFQSEETFDAFPSQRFEVSFALWVSH